MIEAGLWYRPSYFPQPGETTWREACDREVRMVRESGRRRSMSRRWARSTSRARTPRQFLDFVYTNTFSTLAVGRCRYGLMLREDGHVMDDGTTARLGAEHFVMTTTTAAAGPVMQHLEFVHQAHMPEADVRMISVTEQWAQFSIAGPRSLDLVNSLLDQPVDDAGFPFMACGAVSVQGVAGRLFRISFSGERAYETGGAVALRRCALPAAGDAGRDAGRRALRDGGAERAEDREGLHHPCRDPRPHHRLRLRPGTAWCRRRRTSSARPWPSGPG